MFESTQGECWWCMKQLRESVGVVWRNSQKMLVMYEATYEKCWWCMKKLRENFDDVWRNWGKMLMVYEATLGKCWWCMKKPKESVGIVWSNVEKNVVDVWSNLCKVLVLELTESVGDVWSNSWEVLVLHDATQGKCWWCMKQIMESVVEWSNSEKILLSNPKKVLVLLETTKELL